MNDTRAEGIDALAEAITRIADGASRHLLCYVPRADAALWSVPALIDDLRGFVTERRQRQVRLLFLDAENLAREHAALVALHQRVPSLVELRQVDAEALPPAPQGFVVNDQRQLLLFDSGERPGASYSAASERARPLAERFHDAWERARPLGELRALGI